MTISRRKTIAGLALGVGFALGLAPATMAQDSVEQFYAGKTITLMVGYDPGGTYDISARLVARHLGNFIPGKPQVVVQNLPGAVFRIANQFVNDPSMQDGLTFAVFNRALPQLAIQGYPNIEIDPADLNWLGSLSSYADDGYLLLVRAEHPAKTADDLRNPEIKTILGGGNQGSTNQLFAVLARDTLGLNVEVLTGYTGAAPIFLAMQQGEVDGQVIGYASTRTGQRSLWDAGELRPLIQFGRSERLADLPDVPTGRELTTDPDKLALLEFAELPFFMAMPFAVPAHVPEDRVDALEKAFMEMNADPAFQAESDKLGLERSPVDGDAILKLIADAAKAPEFVIEQYNAIAGIPD